MKNRHRDLNDCREIKPLISLKTNISKEDNRKAVNMLLSSSFFSNNDEKYWHCITTLQMFGCHRDKIQAMLSTRIPDFNIKQFNKSFNYIMASFDKNKQPKNKVLQQFFRYLNSLINEEDLFYHVGKKVNKLEIQELQYYGYRLTDFLVKNGGYSSCARNYFLTGFKDRYKQETGRKVYAHKIAAMNKILNQYHIIDIYNQKKVKNMFVVGKENPYYYMEGVSVPTSDEIKNYNQLDKMPLAKQLEINSQLKEELKKKNALIIDQKELLNQLDKDCETLIAEKETINKDMQELINDYSELLQSQENTTQLIDFGTPYFEDYSLNNVSVES